jgi:hypothetical protein
MTFCRVRTSRPTPFLCLKIMVLTGCISLACASCSHKRVPHSSDIPEGWTPVAWTDFVSQGPVARNLPDFSYAGYEMSDLPLPQIDGPLFDVTHPRFGAVADDGRDDTAAIQAAIDAAGAAGGGVVLVPEGRYEIHATPDGRFLRIAQDRIVLRGQGSGDNGTVLHLGAPAPAKGVRRLGHRSGRRGGPPRCHRRGDGGRDKARAGCLHGRHPQGITNDQGFGQLVADRRTDRQPSNSPTRSSMGRIRRRTKPILPPN